MIRTFNEYQQAIQDVTKKLEEEQAEWIKKAGISNARYNQGVADGLDKAFGIFQEYFVSVQQPSNDPYDEEDSEDDD